ncbi:hypothetical protein EO95_09440 [Methanosarcina sp. 1.H.T.1A.1]|uniref:hypothetical protein n=1 Tax=Methanosarcina sp. 1.H.T.1A.1 TaxID=1483602 RepID=UPI000621835D|nr:hypothetical protein [Methanosarcina sp. 1.H.T.1A.1]KKH92891.1 hypothetical protein EO95_09440 [Methanosarcina sp. 1.H.T.1A.1]
MEFIQNWDPSNQTVYELKPIYTRAFFTAIELKKRGLDKDNVSEEVSRYFRYVESPDCRHEPEGYTINDINRMLVHPRIINLNRVIATDYEGNCLLKLNIDNWGNTLKFGFQVRSLARIWKILSNKKKYEDNKCFSSAEDLSKDKIFDT